MYPKDTKIRQGRQTAPDVRSQPDVLHREQAGGATSTGRERIMEIQPSDLHQRVP